MTMQLDLSLVIPIYNELDNLAELTRQIDRALRPLGRSFEVLLVDDASDDGSLERMGNLAAANPHIRILSLQENAGQSAALLAGFQAAKGQVVITLDGDLQNDPADIPRLLEALPAHDLVSGIRADRQDTWLRKVSSKIANRVRRSIVGDDVTDVGCSLKAYRRAWLVDLPPFKGLHRFLPGLLQHRGARVAQVPVHHRPRIHGVSKYGLHNRLWRGLADMAGVCWLQSRWTGSPTVRELAVEMASEAELSQMVVEVAPGQGAPGAGAQAAEQGMAGESVAVSGGVA